MKREREQEPVLLELFKNNCELNLRLSIIEPMNQTWKFKLLSNFQKGRMGVVLANMDLIVNEFSNILGSDIIYDWREENIKEKIDGNEYVICIVDSFYLEGNIYYSKMHKNTMIVIYGYMNGFYKIFVNQRMLGLERGTIKIETLEKLIYKDQIELEKPGVKDFIFTKYPNTTLYIKEEKLTDDFLNTDLSDYYFSENCGIRLFERLVGNINKIIKYCHNRKLDYILVDSLANVIEVKKIHYMIYEYNRDKNMLLLTRNVCDCLGRIKFALGKYLYTNHLECLKYIQEQLIEIVRIEKVCKITLYGH